MPNHTTPKTSRRTHSDTKVEPPKRFQVILLNDDYTTMDFVVAVLMSVFRKDHEEALRVMMNVHRQGMGVAGVYVKDIAEAKCDMVHALAESQGFPLQCLLQPE